MKPMACSRCGEAVPNVPGDVVSVVCSRCLAKPASPLVGKPGAASRATARPMALVRGECCNYRDGGCLPADGACLVEEGGRCSYFESAVLPIADQPPPRMANNPGAANVGLQRLRVGARDAYCKMHGLLSEAAERECPECRGPLPAGKRYCATCREVRNRANRRKADRALYARRKEQV